MEWEKLNCIYKHFQLTLCKGRGGEGDRRHYQKQPPHDSLLTFTVKLKSSQSLSHGSHVLQDCYRLQHQIVQQGIESIESGVHFTHTRPKQGVNALAEVTERPRRE